MRFWSLDNSTRPQQAFHRPPATGAITDGQIRLVLTVLIGVGIGLAVIISTYYAENVKLLIGIIGGIVFVRMTMRWPEFGILCFVALLSGLVSLTWLPILHMGPVSLNICDMMLLLLLGVVFLRATTQPGFKLFGSPLIIPLFLFIGAFLISAVNAVMIHGIGFNEVLRTVRVLILWIAFVPILELVRDEQALRRLLLGLFVLTGILLIGVLFPNRFEPLLYLQERAAGTGSEMYAGLTRYYYSGDMVLYAMIPITIAALAMIKKGNQLWRIGFLCLLLFWLFRTFFRTYWLTLFVICCLLIVFLSSKERIRLLKRVAPAILVGILLLVILTAAQPTLLDRVAYIMTDRLGSLLHDPLKQENSLQWRVIETRYALKQINLHPIFGIGLANSYRPPMENEASSMYGSWSSKYIENGYLYIAVMMGMVGLIPFVWLCAAYLFRVIRHNSEIQDDYLRAVYLGLGIAFLGQVVSNLTSPNFVINARLVFFPIAMGICEVILRLEREKKLANENQDCKAHFQLF